MTQRKTVRCFTKAVDEEARTVEQIVSVFENVDLGREVVKTGAFTGSLERWAAAGDPIPVIWSHAWDDPFAHIGAVVEAKELAAGDPLLPEPIADLGGLWVKYRVDEAPFADQVFRLLKERRVREASFAYDVLRDRKNADGTTDLVELDVIEVGPTLKGMNPATQLLTVKSLPADQAIAAAKRVSHTFLPKDDDPDRCSVCDLTRNTLGHLNLLSTDPDGAKAYVRLPGSIEETLETYFRAAVDHAVEQDMGRGGFYALHPEGTYPGEQRAVYTVEGWDDPIGAGALFEFRFAEQDGEVVVDEIVELELEASVRRKARKAARIVAADASSATPIGTRTVKAVTAKSEGNPEEPATANGEDSATRSGSTGEPARVLVELEALELS